MSSLVRIAVGKGSNQQVLMAYRAVIAHLSEQLEDIFFGPEALVERSIINLTDDDPKAFAVLIQYSEVKKVKLRSIDKAVSAYHLFDKYNIPDAKRQCVTFLEESIMSDTVGRILEIAKNITEESLCYKCWVYILENTENVLCSVTFQDLKEETVSAIIRQDIMTRKLLEVKSCAGLTSEETGVEELSVYKAVEDWGRNKYYSSDEKRNLLQIQRDLRQILEPLLCHIRFLLMSHTDIVEVCRNGVFTAREQLEILKARSWKKLTESSSFLNVSRESRNSFSTLVKSLCFCSNSTTNALQSIIKERFRVKSHNLYILGILKHEDFPKLSDFTFTILNVTTQKEITLKSLRDHKDKTAKDVLLFESVIFVAKNDIFEITIQTDSKEPIPCCIDNCITTTLLERISENQSPGSSTGHILGIYALPIIP